MKLRMLAWAFLSVVLVAASAQAEEARLPASGDPAFVVDLPDGWSHRIDEDGNLLLGAPDHASGFSLSIFVDARTLDDAAADVMKSAKAAPPQNMGAIELSGYRGYVYDTSMSNDAGVNLNVHCIMVKLDPTHVASVSMITAGADSADQYAAARDVLSRVTLTGK